MHCESKGNFVLVNSFMKLDLQFSEQQIDPVSYD